MPFIYFEGKHFDNDVLDHERGNYDFLMGCDIDMNDPEVTPNYVNGASGFTIERG